MTTTTAAPLMTYGALATVNPEFRALVWRELDDLYVGGYQLEQHAAAYMPRMLGEAPTRYRQRLKCSGYIGYLGQIVDFFASNLFTRDVVVTPAVDADDASTAGTAPAPDGFWSEFARDVDLRGSDLAKVLRGAFTTALVKGKGFVACDFPRPVDVPATRAAEETAGTDRGYAFELPVESMLDWSVDMRGRFVWAILRTTLSDRATPAHSRGLVVEEFKVWRMDGGVAVWDIYRTEPHKPGEAIAADVQIPCVESGTTSFKRIPILQLSIPAGLWVGNKIGCLAREHFQRRAALVSAENASMVEIPVVKQGPEMGAVGGDMPSEIQQDPHRGIDPVGKFEAEGFLRIGSGDSLEFKGPNGAPYQIVHDQLSSLVDEMYRVVQQMATSVSSTAVALGRSGASKSLDFRATEIVLSAYGALVRDFARDIYLSLGEARGEDVVWTAHGLDKYDQEDRASTVNEAIQAGQINIPSTTFKKLYSFKTAMALLGPVEPTTQETIQDEIESGVVQAEADAQALKAQMVKAALEPQADPNAPLDPKAKPPPGKPSFPSRNAPPPPRGR